MTKRVILPTLSGMTNTTDRLMEIHKSTRTHTLVFRGIARCSWYVLMKGPRRGLFNNHWYNRSEDFTKHHAANNKKGVVGNKGRNTPTAPKNTQRRPKPMSRGFTIPCTSYLPIYGAESTSLQDFVCLRKMSASHESTVRRQW